MSTSNRKRDPAKALYLDTKSQARRKRGLRFDLTWEEYQKSYTGKCALTGWDISWGYYSDGSLDRIDSSRGYETDNIQWVHRAVNCGKTTMSNEDYIAVCRAVAEHNKDIILNDNYAEFRRRIYRAGFGASRYPKKTL